MTDDAAEWLAECRERAPDILQRFADGIGRGEIMLSAPGCAKGCETCYRECAVRHIAADWWSREWAEAEKLDRPALHHAGITYTQFGRA